MHAQKIQDACFDGRVFQYTIKGHEGMLYHWRMDNGSFATADTLNDTILIKWNAVGSYKLRVFGEYEGCYTDYQEIRVNLHNKPVFYLGEDVSICEGERYTFSTDMEYADISWQNGNKGNSFTADTTTKVWASVLDKNGCFLSDTAYVFMNPLPQVDLGVDTMLCGEQKLVLNALSPLYDGTIYKWTMPNANMNYITDATIEIESGPGEYSVVVTDVFGCTSYDTIQISKCNRKFNKDKVGKAITPNNDGFNDLWDIEGLTDDYPDALVDIYDRWGRLVFRSERGYRKAWDGKGLNSSDGLPMDSYYYIINLNKDNESPVAGTLILVR